MTARWGLKLLLLHVFSRSQHTICSLWGNQPVSGWNITGVPPTHLTDNPSSSPCPRVGLPYKNRRIRQRRHILPRETNTSAAAAAAASSGLRILTFSLINSQMILVISSPSISTTGWDTLMRLSASVVNTHTQHRERQSERGRFN